MQFGAVTFMLAERILRKPRAKVTHHSVARDLGDHAGRGDAQADAITINDGRLRKRKWNNRQAIDQNVVGGLYERFDRQPHSAMARTKNIDPIDLDGIDDAYCPSDFRIRDEVAVDFLAQFRRELFGIVQAAVTEFFRQDHRRRDHWTRQRAAACVIDPGDASDAISAKFFLVTKSAAPVHLVDLAIQ